MKVTFSGLILPLLVLSPLACGKREEYAGTASVSGKVIWDKNPLIYGAVQFYTPDTVHTAMIQTDGNYQLQHLAEGTVTICIRMRGELTADSRFEEQSKKMFAQKMKEIGKDKMPKGMTVEDLMIMSKKGGDRKPGRIPGKGKDAEMIAQMQIPLVNGTPLQAAQGLPPAALLKFGQLHDKYGEASKSPLTYTVQPGAQSYDIILK